MKNRFAVIMTVIFYLLLPVSMTYIYCTSTYLEDTATKVFRLTGQPSWTKSEQQELKKTIEDIEVTKESYERIVKENKILKENERKLKIKNALLKRWAEKNGKLRTLQYVKKRFGGRIKIASQRYAVKKELITAVIVTEWNRKCNRSKKGAIGPMQLMPATAKILKVNRHHEFENILGGTAYLSKLMKQYNGNLKLALAAYNAGPRNVDEYKGIPPFKETRNYVDRVKFLLNYQLNDA